MQTITARAHRCQRGLSKKSVPLSIWMFTALFLVANLAAQAQPNSEAQVQSTVRQFFPHEELRSRAKENSQVGPEHATYKLADLDGKGELDYIVAAYDDSTNGVVRLLRKADRGYLLASEIQTSGLNLRANLEYFDKGPRPIIVVVNGDLKNHDEYSLYNWDGHQLSLIGPTAVDRKGNKFSILGDAAFIDLYGTGVKNIIGRDQDPKPEMPWTVYRLDGSIMSKLAFYHSFPVINGTENTEELALKKRMELTRFRSDRTDTSCRLIVINRQYEKGAFVSDAIITLNGTRVVGLTSLDRKKPLEIPIDLLEQNVLQVEAHGDKGSLIAVAISYVSDVKHDNK